MVFNLLTGLWMELRKCRVFWQDYNKHFIKGLESFWKAWIGHFKLWESPDIKAFKKNKHTKKTMPNQILKNWKTILTVFSWSVCLPNLEWIKNHLKCKKLKKKCTNQTLKKKKKHSRTFVRLQSVKKSFYGIKRVQQHGCTSLHTPKLMFSWSSFRFCRRTQSFSNIYIRKTSYFNRGM